MNVGFVGLGKLGLPCALSASMHGHKVVGFDPSPVVEKIIKEKKIPYKEEKAQEYLESTKDFRLGSLEEVINHADLIFVPIQTPHDPRFEGTMRLPEERVDFNYEFLKAGINSIAATTKKLKKNITVVIISTVLPGTIEREIKPLLNQWITLIYNPFFIAMGTTINDFENPEFVLMGADEGTDVTNVLNFYQSIHNKKVVPMSIKTAELTKVAYNTFIGFKIIFINAMMEICHKTGANVDDLSLALSQATERIISPKYLQGGMGDGGGCHPRDNIAMSWLAEQINLSHDIFTDMMQAREDQTEWLADLIAEEQKKTGLPVYLLGKAYKPETNLTVGSPATLLANILEEKGVDFKHLDPFVDPELYHSTETPAIYFIATKHDTYKKYEFLEGDIVIDPFGFLEQKNGEKIIKIGRPN